MRKVGRLLTYMVLAPIALVVLAAAIVWDTVSTPNEREGREEPKE
jgi:hypothetical protein